MLVLYILQAQLTWKNGIEKKNFFLGDLINSTYLYKHHLYMLLKFLLIIEDYISSYILCIEREKYDLNGFVFYVK